MLNQKSEKACRWTAKKYGIPEDLFCAIVEKESAGKFFWTVGGKQVPAIRPEAHYFYRALKVHPIALKRAVKEKLASPKPNYNVPGQPSKVYALFNQMIAIDAEAAAYSISMGVGQVMGAHFKRLGFKSAWAMWEMAQSGESGQLMLMAEFIKTDARLFKAFQSRDFKTIALLYNGKDYKRNNYDVKLREYADKYETKIPKTKTIAAVAGMGGTGLGIGGTIVGSSQDAQEFIWGISPITDSIAMISENAATIVGAATALVVLGFLAAGIYRWATRKE